MAKIITINFILNMLHNSCTGTDLVNKEATIPCLLFHHQKLFAENAQSHSQCDLLHHLAEKDTGSLITVAFPADDVTHPMALQVRSLIFLELSI
jgi:hypothetical protein